MTQVNSAGSTGYNAHVEEFRDDEYPMLEGKML